MSDELPAGEKAVYVFLEMVAFCFLLACVDALVGKKSWFIWLSCLVLAVAFFLAGIKWPKIKKMLPNRATRNHPEFTSVARTIPNESSPVESEGRTVVDVTPEYLLGLFEGRQKSWPPFISENGLKYRVLLGMYFLDGAAKTAIPQV